MEQYFQEPFSAARHRRRRNPIAYVFARNKMNGEEKVKNFRVFQASVLVGLLVYLIVSQGQGSHGPVSKEPF
jgi:hypothetical protein